MSDDARGPLGRRSDKLRQSLMLTIEGRDALEVGDAEKALSVLSKKHDLILQLFGAASGRTGTSLIDLSHAYHIAGRQREARAMIDEALSIYQRLHRADHQLDRLEEIMMDICARQGHSFEVEQIAKARISRLSELGAEQDADRAVTQDYLANLYLEQRRNDEAISLLIDSLAIFERTSGPSARDTSVCCLYLSRAYLKNAQAAKAAIEMGEGMLIAAPSERPTQQELAGREKQEREALERAEFYGRRALESAKASEGTASEAAAIAADELAVAVAFNAKHAKSAQKAAEALELSDWALSRFRVLQGEDGKETLRSQHNSRRLRSLLKELSRCPDVEDARPSEDVIALPTKVFISHSYADKDALAVLMAALPDYVEAIIFEPIVVPPSDYVSEKLISGVLGAAGFIFIDSAASRASFWTAFERDLAERNQKRMFRFDPATRRLASHSQKPRQLFLAHLYHPADADDVSRIMRWLIDQRSFEAFDDPDQDGEQIPPFSQQEAQRRDRILFSARTFGTIYLLFLSNNLLKDDRLRTHAVEQVTLHPRSTMICWLDRPEDLLQGDATRQLTHVPEDGSYTLSARPTDPSFNVHELDDLMVRLYWLLHQGRFGDWFR
jgi:hypothetical protein